jgi:hypothetical protein
MHESAALVRFKLWCCAYLGNTLIKLFQTHSSRVQLDSAKVVGHSLEARLMLVNASDDGVQYSKCLVSVAHQPGSS